MSLKTIFGYLISILFVMPTAFCVTFRALGGTILFGFITFVGGCLAIQEFTLNRVMKYLLVISIFAVIGHYLGIYLLLLALVGSGRSP